MHTKDILALELRKAGLSKMAQKAEAGYYHDYLSPLVSPGLQLAEDLADVGTSAALALRERHLKGEFDASKEEAEAWLTSAEGRKEMAAFIEGLKYT